MFNIFVKFIATGCFVGKSKIAPGTLGSLVGILLTTIMYLILTQMSACVQSSYCIISFWAIYLILLNIIGFICTKIYITKFNTKDSDPKEVVIDEIIGMSLTMIICIPASQVTQESGSHLLFKLLSTFVLFRVFDILKPWPINYIDKNVKGATGIILDDVVASLFASVAYYSILLLKS